MNHFLFEAGLVNAALASVLAVGVWLATRVWRQPVLIHALWVIVLVKLITPPMVTIPWRLTDVPSISTMRAIAGANPASDQMESVPMRLQTAESAPFEAQTVFRSAPLSAARMTSPNHAVRARTESQPPAATSPTRSWVAIAATTWLTGIGIFLAVSLVRLMRFHRALAGTAAAPHELSELADGVATRFGIRSYRLRVTDGRLSPLVWPVGRPTIVLSRPLLAELSAEETQTLLAHEFAHLRRKDHWVRWLELISVTIYWWHPVAWWARAMIRRNEEPACDAWVVWAFPDAAKRYAAALFTAVEFVSQSRTTAPIVASRLDSGGHLKERIENIMSGNCRCTLSSQLRIAVLVLTVLTVPLSLRTVHAENEEPSAQESQSDAATDVLSRALESAASSERGDREVEIERRLDTSVSLQYLDAPLSEVMDVLAESADVDIHFDPVGLKQEGVASDTPVTIELKKKVSLRSALNLVLEPLGLRYVIEDEVLKITNTPSGNGVIAPGDVLIVAAAGVDPANPIHDAFQVEPSGTLALGPAYGRVKVAGHSLQDAEQAIREHLRNKKQFKDPLVQITSATTPAASNPYAYAETPHSGLRHPSEPMSGTSAEEINVLREEIENLQELFKYANTLHQAREGSIEQVQVAGYELALANGELALAEGRVGVALQYFENAKAYAEQASATVAANYKAGEASYNQVLQAANDLSDIKLRLIRVRQTQVAPPSRPQLTFNDSALPRAESDPSTSRSESSASVDVWKKKVEIKKRQYERSKLLADKGVITAAALERAKSEYEIAAAELEQALRELKYSQLLVELAETEYQEALEKNKRNPNSVSDFELRKLQIKIELARVKMSAAE